ncbi:hypothetical protein HLH44_17595 [Gluconacetobacter sp. 1c LMG 22058]|uniref:Uncharacterized protein n=1 Tax=Gluconacetobacter dulcium TaxID=2729096 RepID=A0A7W4K2M4_9PROT|nr:hypothetical protein [Gluconacetobacter dulcium]MBB2199227.1 hypothetical protein [Gluconacetobacter dulcium]
MAENTTRQGRPWNAPTPATIRPVEDDPQQTRQSSVFLLAVILSQQA